MLRFVKYLSLLFVVAILVIILSLTLWSRQVQPGDGFKKLLFNFAFYDWFDAGVVDIDGCESAHYSQGHYRSYFGLGNNVQPVDQRVVVSRERKSAQ